ncbi:hypothetical protein ABPG73_021337 [Tetrahymena malaccensis]
MTVPNLLANITYFLIFLNLTLFIAAVPDILPIQVSGNVYQIQEQSAIIYKKLPEALWRYSTYIQDGSITETYILNGFQDLAQSFYFIEQNNFLNFYTNGNPNFQIIDLGKLTNMMPGYLQAQPVNLKNQCTQVNLIRKYGNYYFYICQNPKIFFYEQSVNLLQTSTNSYSYSQMDITQDYIFLYPSLLCYKGNIFTQFSSLTANTYKLIDLNYDFFLLGYSTFCIANLAVSTQTFSCKYSYFVGSSKSNLILTKVFESNRKQLVFTRILDTNNPLYIKYEVFDVTNLQMISRGFSSFEDNTSSQTIIQYENIMFPSKGYKWNIAYNPQGVNIIGNEKSVPQSHTYLLVNEPFYNLNFQQGFTIFLSQDNTNYLLDFRDIMNLNCPAGQHIQLDFTCSISNCPSFSSLDTTKNKCYCDPNAFYSPTANSCTCSYGFTSSDSQLFKSVCEQQYYTYKSKYFTNEKVKETQQYFQTSDQISFTSTIIQSILLSLISSSSFSLIANGFNSQKASFLILINTKLPDSIYKVLIQFKSQFPSMQFQYLNAYESILDQSDQQYQDYRYKIVNLSFNILQSQCQQRYTYPFQDKIYSQQYYLNEQKQPSIVIPFQLKSCLNTNRKLLISDLSLDIYFAQDGFVIDQSNIDNSSVTFNLYKDTYQIVFVLTEICIDTFYVEKIKISNIKFDDNGLFQYKITNPPNFNKNMKAFPYIIGATAQTYPSYLFIQEILTQDDGFLINFKSSQQADITLIIINYIYYDQTNNLYYKILQIVDQKYLQIQNPNTFFNQISTIQIQDIYECEKTYCKQYSIVGFTGYKSNQNANLRYFLKMNITQQNEISINYSTWSNSVLYGVQSQFLLFQMVVCLNGLANFRDQCQECPSGFFQQQDIIRNINICVKCDSSCLTCKQSSTKCTSCSQENPYFLKDQNKCQQQYPNQYYCEKDLNSSIQYNCTLCINCLQCRSQVECCDNNLFKFNFQNQNCECFDQQTMVYHTNHQKCSCKDENTMVNNIKNCTCKDTSNMKYNPIQQKCECLDLETMVFDNYKCICKDEQMTFQISQNKCVCNENMQFNSTTFKCDCIDVNNMIYNPQNKMCECPPNNSCQFCNTQDGYFISGTRCIACALGCKTCKGSLATDCLTCVEYKYLFTDYTCRQCITGDGYFTKNIYCLPCDQTCQTCFGENKNQCQSCFEDSQLINSVCEQQYYTYKSKYFTNEKVKETQQYFQTSDQISFTSTMIQSILLSLISSSSFSLVANGFNSQKASFLILINTKLPDSIYKVLIQFKSQFPSMQFQYLNAYESILEQNDLQYQDYRYKITFSINVDQSLFDSKQFFMVSTLHIIFHDNFLYLKKWVQQQFYRQSRYHMLDIFNHFIYSDCTVTFLLINSISSRNNKSDLRKKKNKQRQKRQRQLLHLGILLN